MTEKCYTVHGKKLILSYVYKMLQLAQQSLLLLAIWKAKSKRFFNLGLMLLCLHYFRRI